MEQGSSQVLKRRVVSALSPVETYVAAVKMMSNKAPVEVGESGAGPCSGVAERGIASFVGGVCGHYFWG